MTDYQLLVGFLLTVGLFLAFAYLIVQSKNSNSSNNGMNDSAGDGAASEIDSEPDKMASEKTDSGKEKSTIYISDDFKSDSPLTEKENNHIIKKIYIYKNVENTWICPCCETENHLSDKNCCLCQYIKQVER